MWRYLRWYTHICAERLIMDNRYKLIHSFNVDYQCHRSCFTWITCWIINTNNDKCVYDVTSVEINDVFCCEDRVVDYLKFRYNVISRLNRYWWTSNRGSDRFIELSLSEQFSFASNESWKKRIQRGAFCVHAYS